MNILHMTNDEFEDFTHDKYRDSVLQFRCRFRHFVLSAMYDITCNRIHTLLEKKKNTTNDEFKH